MPETSGVFKIPRVSLTRGILKSPEVVQLETLIENYGGKGHKMA